MAFRSTLRRLATRLAARAINGNRAHPALSYAWLNQQAWNIVQRPGLAGIRPHYTWGTLQAAALAKTLGHTRVAAIEFGVAGGRGLQALEAAAREIGPLVGVEIEVVGFDTGQGLPAPVDARDLPNLYSGGDYRMDVAALRARLREARVVLGPIRDTLPEYLASATAPVGFVSVDVDYYSSTVDCLVLLDAAPALLLPRAWMYLDDSLGLTFSDWNGERLAVREFNERHEHRKVDRIRGLRFDLPWPLSQAKWTEMMYMFHCCDHPDYCRRDNLIPSASAPLAQ